MSSSATEARAADARGRVHTIHYEMSYIRQGRPDGSDTPVIVLLHDFPGDATLWQSVMPALTAYPVLAFDLLGFGQSDRPWPADTSVWGHADAINLALREMGVRRVIPAGFGLGGGIAQILATRLAPDLVRGMALISSQAFQYAFQANWPMTEMAKRQDPEAAMHTPTAEVEADLRRTIPQGSADPASISGAALDRYVKPWLDDLGKEVLFQQVRNLVPYYLNAVGDDLRHIDAPTLIVWGERDTVLPVRLGHWLNRTIPGSQMVVVPNAGHLMLNDAPAAVARALADFTARL